MHCLYFLYIYTETISPKESERYKIYPYNFKPLPIEQPTLVGDVVGLKIVRLLCENQERSLSNSIIAGTISDDFFLPLVLFVLRLAIGSIESAPMTKWKGALAENLRVFNGFSSR